MVDPLAELVSLLQPSTPYSKMVSGAGAWSVRRSDYRQPFYAVILEGSCSLAVDGYPALVLQQGDFILIPSALSFAMSSLAPAMADHIAHHSHASAAALLHGEIRHGMQSGPPDVRWLVGYCVFGSPDAALLVSLLPPLVHVRGESRLSTIVQLVGDESRALRPGRDVILARLLEVLLIEALRSAAGTAAAPGLLRGLADERLALALRSMHQSPGRRWTVAQLAQQAALSRSTFFERFSRAVGLAPMEYLLAWRMAMAMDLLRRKQGGIAEVAEKVGYGSASAFSVAFTRHTGRPPTRYAREQLASHSQ